MKCILVVLLFLVVVLSSMVSGRERFSEAPPSSRAAGEVAYGKLGGKRVHLGKVDVHSPPGMAMQNYGASVYSEEEVAGHASGGGGHGDGGGDGSGDGGWHDGEGSGVSGEGWQAAMTTAKLNEYGPQKYFGDSELSASDVYGSLALDCATKYEDGTGDGVGVMVCGMEVMALDEAVKELDGSADEGKEEGLGNMRDYHAECMSESVGSEPLEDKLSEYWSCLQGKVAG